ncbi:ABC transporter substrate-binding protein [Brachybacterium sp. JHP9]|uniref:ABC transporter substrate-binding protein n=1 Tax=Brachybacterium equifaecis TaxID=2910770 RepID=A0ABT0QYE0_9MICO|nr:ABC transporter substrate-binding protein [Brachybacterium equifaecis]MCL6422029.1 ABC transporter substrate-binding protein [Brachybacterium equifaecis]
MQIRRRSLILGSGAAGASALALAACGSGGSGSGGGASSSGDAVVFVNNTEPENPLIPTNTSELGGGDVLNACFSCLLAYAADGSSENEVAKSIESEDAQNWTITLEEGWKFSDGTPVTAKSFVDAWNFGALTTNAQRAQSFFEPIEGFADVSAKEPTAETMSGLAVVDDHTFTVRLNSPQSDFPSRLGYWAFAPLPESAFEDIEAFGELPVSNGPYKVESWTHDSEIVCVPNPEYTGPRPAKNAGITFVVYADEETAYNDLASGSLDVIGGIPSSALSTFEDELGERAINQPAAILQFITIPQYDPNFQGEAGALRRKAFSRAIDRAQICEAIFFGTRVPATDFTSTSIEGGGATDIPGSEVLQFDAAEAKSLWEQAEAISPFQGELTLSYNADGPNKDWVEAVCNSVTNSIGVTAVPTPYPAFGAYKEQIAAREITGPFRSSWVADYPSVFNFLFPLYASASADGNGSNDGQFKNEEFDRLLAEGQQATDPAEALAKWKDAQAVLMENLPSVPLWYQNTMGGHSEAVSDVKFSWNGGLLFPDIVKG